MPNPMEYENFTFKTIKYLNGPERDPHVMLKYRAESMDDGTPKESKDKIDDLPHKPFRETWRDLLEFWKMNLEQILGDIDWSHEEIRIAKVQMKWENEKPVAVKYNAKVSTGFDETAKIPTPYMSPGMKEGEIDLLKDLSSTAEEYLHGARDQGTLFDESDPTEQDSSEEESGGKEVMEKDGGDSDTNTDIDNLF